MFTYIIIFGKYLTKSTCRYFPHLNTCGNKYLNFIFILFHLAFAVVSPYLLTIDKMCRHSSKMLLCSTKQKQHKNSCLLQRPVTHLQILSALRVDFGSQPMAHTSGRKQGKGKQKEGVNNEPLMTSLPSGQWAQQQWGGKTGGPWREAYAVATLSCATGASWSCSHTHTHLRELTIHKQCALH